MVYKIKILLSAAVVVMVSGGLVFSAGRDTDNAPRIVLVVSEQNINGPQKLFWSSSINLANVESALVNTINAMGYRVVDPAVAGKAVKKNPAFNAAGVVDDGNIDLSDFSKLADYAIVAKAVASRGAKLPHSHMVSCFANVTARLIRIQDGQVLRSFGSGASAVHVDAVTGGAEAMASAGRDLAVKIVNELNSLEDK